ncbi:murein biosynthesis integral membrane protein MurJ [Candidatus Saccharibacteria bacterium]|jgi:putative peptidoglycan lipid II flippase|nr:murein biosynthesis integral membrane protein MurJ [Candidatus Saccharibacteria bacterium]
MKLFFAKANRRLSIGSAAMIISGSYFASAILGLMRDRLLAGRFGIESGVLDAYWTAFSIPNTMYYLLVTGALSVTFIPVYIERLQKGNKKSAFEISSSMLNLMGLTTLIGSIAIFIFANPLIHIIAPGFTGARHDLAVSLMRIVAINPFVFSISTVLGSMQQASGRFLFFSLAPITYNLGIIAGIIFLSPHFGIQGVALGVAFGSLIQLGVNLIGMIGMGFQYRPQIFWKNKGFRQVFKLLIPRSLDQGIDQINALVEQFIASFLAYGAVTSYQYAFNLQNQPIILIGVAISTAAFPSITSRAASTRTDLFRKQVLSTVGSILWFALPAAVIAFIMRGYLVRLYLGQGNEEIANALGFFVGAIVGRSVFHTLTRAFYAQQDTKTPLRTSLVVIGLNMALAFIFVDWFNGSIVGLALAQSVAGVLESIVLFWILHKRYGGFLTLRFGYAVLKIITATTVMGIVLYLMVRFVLPLRVDAVGFFEIVPRFLGILIPAGLAYLAASFAVGLREAGMITDFLKHHVFKPIKLPRIGD